MASDPWAAFFPPAPTEAPPANGGEPDPFMSMSLSAQPTGFTSDPFMNFDAFSAAPAPMQQQAAPVQTANTFQQPPQQYQGPTSSSFDAFGGDPFAAVPSTQPYQPTATGQGGLDFWSQQAASTQQMNPVSMPQQQQVPSFQPQQQQVPSFQPQQQQVPSFQPQQQQVPPFQPQQQQVPAFQPQQPTMSNNLDFFGAPQPAQRAASPQQKPTSPPLPPQQGGIPSFPQQTAMGEANSSKFDFESSTFDPFGEGMFAKVQPPQDNLFSQQTMAPVSVPPQQTTPAVQPMPAVQQQPAQQEKPAPPQANSNIFSASVPAQPQGKLDFFASEPLMLAQSAVEIPVVAAKQVDDGEVFYDQDEPETNKPASDAAAAISIAHEKIPEKISKMQAWDQFGGAGAPAAGSSAVASKQPASPAIPQGSMGNKISATSPPPRAPPIAKGTPGGYGIGSPSVASPAVGDTVISRKLRILKELPPASCLCMFANKTQNPGETPFDAVAVLRETELLSMAKLSACRTMMQKKTLLDTAIAMCNRDTLLLVVLWLRETLKQELFYQEIYCRPQAVDVYANYMREAERWEELEAFRTTVRWLETKSPDRRELQTRTSTEMALAMVHRALTKATPDEQLAVMKDILAFGASVPKGTMWEASELDGIIELCSQWQELLRKQVEIEKIDAATPVQIVQPQMTATGIMEAPPVSMFVKFPRPCIIGLTVLETIDYVTLYHPNDKEDQLASPKSLRKLLKVSDKLYWYSAFTSLAKAGAWDIIRSATQSKSMFTNKDAYKSPVGWRPLINLLYQWGEPNKDAELRKLAIVFMAQMEDRVEAFNLAVYKLLWEAAIQACVDLRDEDRLVELRVRIAQEPAAEVKHFIDMIDEVYRDTKIKWKTALNDNAPKMLGSRRLAAGITGMFKKDSDSSIAGIFKKGLNKLSGKKESEASSAPVYTHEQHLAEAKVKATAVFGASGGGIIDDD